MEVKLKKPMDKDFPMWCEFNSHAVFNETDKKI